MNDASALSALLDRLCDAAARETMARFRVSIDITNKETDGFDPVTEGDRAAERAIRSILSEEVPDHGIVGEEYGTENETAEWQWIIDPIDGTRAFISGLPVWGTLIGLYKNGLPHAGVLDQPFTRERFKAIPGSNGLESTLSIDAGQPKALRTKSTQDLASATLMTTSPFIFSSNHQPRYAALEQTAKLTRYGCDCYAYAMVAAGQIDLVAEAGLSNYDIAALIPIVEGAGGLVTSWEGTSAAQGGTILASANPDLHKKALEALNV